MSGFLLTRPLRDVTERHQLASQGRVFLLTRPLRDVTVLLNGQEYDPDISTHTPLAGRDTLRYAMRSMRSKFLLTRPLRDVTRDIRC